jgi:hypothetical protein
MLQLVITASRWWRVFAHGARVRPHLQGVERGEFRPGELVLFGAYVAWATILSMRLPLYIALPLTLGIAIALGSIIERGVLRPLIGRADHLRDHGDVRVASVIRGFLNMTWGSDTRPFPCSSPAAVSPGPVPVSPVHLWSFVVVIALLAGFSCSSVLDHRDGDARDGGQPAGGPLARRQRQADLRVVVVHRHGRVGARRDHPRERAAEASTSRSRISA